MSLLYEQAVLKALWKKAQDIFLNKLPFKKLQPISLPAVTLHHTHAAL
jgi:hypothetical protein